MKKVLYTDFIKIQDELSEIFPNCNPEKDTKRGILFDFWEKVVIDVVGEGFKGKSKPYSLNDKGLLSVACENSFVSNELFMAKSKLLEKISQYALEVDVEVLDILFNPKMWKASSW